MIAVYLTGDSMNSRQHRDRDAPRAALMSAILPGWGHAFIGQPRTAFGLYLIDLLLLASALVVVARFKLEVARLFFNPTALLVLMAMNVVLLIFRAIVVAGAYSMAPSGGARSRWWSAAFLIAALAVLVIPHAAFGYVAWHSYDVIRSVFQPSDPQASPPTSTSSTSSTTPPTTVPGATTTLPPTTTTTAPPPIWDGLERLNVLLLGADAGPGRRGTRTDTLILVSIEPSTGHVVMVSVPRQLSNPPLPAGMGIWDCNCVPDLITHVYYQAEMHPEAFPGPQEPPINAIKGTFEEIFGVPIHYYAMVTLQGFVDMVDALGGVTIDVPKTIVDETYPHEDGSVEHVVIEKGRQHLNGHLALAYARIRRHSDDFARMHRQRCVIGALVDQADPFTILRNFGRIAQAIKENVSTDIPQDKLDDFVDLLPKVSSNRIDSLRITRDEYSTGAAPGRVFYDIDRIRAETHDLMNDPDAARERLGLDDLQATCDQSFD
ncbi:MAG TPA: LCP family protein [Acidimicrobiia bacterium]